MKQAKHMRQFQQLRRQQRNGNECCQVYCQRARKEIASLEPLWLKDCFKYIILSFCKSSVSILGRNNTFGMCKDMFTLFLFFFFYMEMFIDFPIRFQISLCPYVTIPSIISKDAVADLAVVIKLKPHCRFHM